MSTLGIIGLVVYSLIGLYCARRIGQSICWDKNKPSWDDFIGGIFGGLFLGLFWAVWVPPALFVRLCKNDPKIAARAVFGEPPAIKKRRILEGKVQLAQRTRELEAKLEDYES